MCRVLKEIYQNVYEEDFDYQDFDKRVKLQKAVYLLENMGLNVGDYSFTWALYGPYSLRLDGDALQSMTYNLNPDIVFSDYALKCFSRLKTILQKRESYDERNWMECIASIHFLKNISHYDKEKLFQVLTDKKPHLNQEIENEKAYEVVDDIEGSIDV